MAECFYSPTELSEAIVFYQNNPDTLVFAGGTDLLIGWDNKKFNLSSILNLSKIEKLRSIHQEADGSWIIGAMATMNQLEEHPELKSIYPFLPYAASKLGSWQIRNSATAGGNVCNAAPSAEIVPSLMALDSSVRLVGPEGERTLALADFATGPGQTCLKESELLSEIVIPKIEGDVSGKYVCRKLRRSVDISLVSITAFLHFDGGKIIDARLCLGAVAPTVIRAEQAEKYLIGRTLDQDTITATAKMVADASSPISDVRSTAEYRLDMMEICTRDALTEIAEERS
ncbi:MAG: xanthine dehydrogenase family protein subunit M [Desulfobulbaceae bacterium]|nr:xanthine dehydrogenase family protein subunit M [Desulfobulbaceae bacterium]